MTKESNKPTENKQQAEASQKAAAPAAAQPKAATAGAPKKAATGGRVLRIGVIQSGKVIEERIVREKNTITVGTNKTNMFSFSDEKAQKTWPLFEYAGGSYTLVFDKSMTGKITIDSDNLNLSNIMTQNLAQASGDRYKYKLDDKSRGSIKLTDTTTIMFQFKDNVPAAAGPVLPASAQGGWIKSIEPFFTGALAGSFLVHALMTVIVFTVDPPPPPSAEDARKFIAKLSKVEIPEEEPEPDVDDEGEEEDESEKESDKPAKKEEAKADKAPAKDEGPKKPVSSEKRANVQAQIAKNSAMLALIGAAGTGGGDSEIANIFGEGSNLGDVTSDLSGTGGIGIAGSGDDVTRRGGAGEGGGQGAEIGDLKAGGNGEGPATAPKKKATVKAGMKAAAPRIDGEIDQKSLNRTLKKRAGAFKKCYEQALKTDSKLKGKVKVEFTISEQGRVVDARVIKDSVKSPQVNDCLVKAFKRLRFPKPDGGEVVVSYTLVFQPG